MAQGGQKFQCSVCKEELAYEFYGKRPPFNSAPVTVTLEGTLDNDITGGTVTLSLFWNTRPLLQQMEVDLCSGTIPGVECPEHAGAISRTTSRRLPGFLPRGHYDLHAVVVDQTDEEVACLTAEFDIQQTGAAPAAPSPVLTEEELAKKKKREEQRKEAKAAKQAKFEAKQKNKTEACKKPKDDKKKAEKESSSPSPAAPAGPFVNTTPAGEKKDLGEEMAATYSPPRVEAAWYEWWEKQGFFRPEYNTDPAAPKFVMVIPPPNVTGALHLGHALTNSIEDSIARWHRMLGHKTLWVPGMDHAGISTQVVVEKKLMREKGITRHDVGREQFVQSVWEWKREYGGSIVRQLRRLGSSVDWQREAFTMDEQRCKAVTEAFVRLHEAGLIYRDNRLVNWCCTLKTAISDIEVDYIDLTGPTMLKVPGHGDRKYPFGELVHFAYKIEGSDEEVVCATTRIETMLVDAAVAIHPEDPRYKHLHGKRVVHPFNGQTIPIILDAVLVDPKFGTGCVKVTPAHDPNDYETAQRHGLPLVSMFTPEGLLNDRCGRFEGLKRFDARIAVRDALKELGLLRGTSPNPMRIAVCSRSKDIIEPRLVPQWYVRCKGMAEASMQAAREERLRIYPESARADWFRWLENIRDWCISRQLWWGHRIPAYLVSINGKPASNPDMDDGWVCARTEAEARAKAAKRFGVSEESIGLEQDPDVLDTWFSSGLFPFSTMGWPEQTPDMDNYYPGTLLETGYDILFFWVARMVMMGLQLTGKLPFTEVFLHSMVRDAHGRKMSKTLGNVIDPIDVIEGITLEQLGEKLLHGNLAQDEVAKARAGQKTDFPSGIAECGTDAMRFALCAYTSQARDINLDINRVVGYRNFCNKIWNAVRFVLLKLGKGFAPAALGDGQTAAGASNVDRWILSRLAAAARDCNRGFETYDLSLATTAVYSFWLYELCDVYLEAIKPVVAESDAARQTLYTCVEVGLRLLHPFMPFVTEELWQGLPRRPGQQPPSVMVAAYPTEAATRPWADAALEEDVRVVMDVVKGIRAMNAPYAQDIKRSRKNPHVYINNRAQRPAELCAAYAATIKVLAYCGELTLLDNVAQPEAGWSVQIVSSECEVYSDLAGIIDPVVETAKLSKRVEKINDDLRPLYKNRNDPDFADKTPADVRQQMIAKIATLEEELALANKAIESLAKMMKH
eukprot:m51a1_g11806 putative valine--trna ligase (1185) ;mRNA; f:346372-351255